MYLNNQVSSHGNADFEIDASKTALTIGLVTKEASEECGGSLGRNGALDIMVDPDVHLELTLFGAGEITGINLAVMLQRRLTEWLLKRREETSARRSQEVEEEESWQSQLNDEPII